MIGLVQAVTTALLCAFALSAKVADPGRWGGDPHKDRLVRVTKTDGTVVDHVYDVDGNRVRTTVTPTSGPAVVTNHLVDTTGGLSQVVAERRALSPTSSGLRS